MIQTYRNLPPIVTGYPIDDIWSVVVPVARTNLVTNPSFEVGTTSWTAVGGSIARSTTYQYHGAYSLAITPTAATTDGARFDTVSLISGTTYAYSAKVRGVGGLKYKLAIETTGGVELSNVTFTATGRWQWVHGYYTETSSTTRRLTVRKASHASTAIFYIDGAQVEVIASGETVSTYLDGDQLGLVPNQQPAAYYWNGTPHASTSTRSGLTRAGGMVVKFSRYGFLLTAIIGLGLAAPQNVATEYARIDGGFDDYTRKPPRQFSLAGRFQGTTYAQLRDQRGRLSRLFDRDLIAQDQQLTLLRQIGNTEPARIIAKYESGLGGTNDNQVAESAAITFTSYLPLIGSDAEAGSALAVQSSVSSANYIQSRDPVTGAWAAVSSGTVAGASGDVNAIQVAPDGKVYVGGVFATASGVANTSRIAYYDPTDGAFHAMGTGAAGGNVNRIAIGPDGTVYVAGSFTSMGGVANTAGLAKWNGSAWSALGTGPAGGAVAAIVVDPTGNLYAGGAFTSMGGVANTLRIAMWNGSAWSALGTGADDTVQALAVAPNGTLYLGGDFLNLNGSGFTRIASWNGTAFSALGTGMGNTVFGLAIGPNLFVYAAGAFTTAGGVSATRAAYWNGVQWSAMGSGLGANGRAITVAPDGGIWFTGSMTTAGGVVLRSPIARWNGAGWSGADNNLVGSTTTQAIAFDPAGKMYVGYSSFGTATASGLVTVTNLGTARSYPTIVINGPSSSTARIYSIINPTTNRAIYLNLTINSGETCTLILQPDAISFTSTFQGNISGSILPGSNEADFFLQPGANVIAVLSGVSTVTATVRWRPSYASLDDVP